MAAPPTPQRKLTFRSRVGEAIRRSSTAFSIPGLPNRGISSTPPPPEDSDTASIVGSVSGKLDREGSTTSPNKVDTTPPRLQVPVPVSSAPSPVPESPAREAAASAAEALPAAAKASSPLANEVLKADATSKQGSTPPRSISGTLPASESDPATATPPSQPSVIAERQPSQTAPAPALTVRPEEIPAQRAAASSTPSSHPVSKSDTSSPPASAPPSAPVTPAALASNISSYFGNMPRSTTPVELDSDSDTNVWADYRAGGSDSGSEVSQESALANQQSKSSLRPRDSSAASSQVAPPLSQSRTASRKASGVIQSRQTELAGVTRTWSSSSDMGLANKTSPSLQVDTKLAVVQGQTDPAVSPTETVHVPEDIDPRSPRDDTMLPSEPQVPLPAMHEVMATGPRRQTSSTQSDRSISDGERYFPRTNDEIRPLISRPSTPPIITNYSQTASSQIVQSYRSVNPAMSQPVPQWAQPARFDVNESVHNYAYGSATRPHVNRGWTEYALPHGIRYYVNEDSRAITDLDLRNVSKLDEVSNTIDTSDDVPDGCEMWIRAGSNAKKGWRKHKAGSEPVLFWVDHRHRRVLNEAPSDDYVSSGEDDRLDDEYRYWAFIEMHPAHIPRGIAESVRKDAIDALRWSHTDHLLTHPHLPSPSPPFSQDECKELFELLDGEAKFDDSKHPISLSFTRTAARVLLRVVNWRQVNFREKRSSETDPREPQVPLPATHEVMAIGEHSANDKPEQHDEKPSVSGVYDNQAPDSAPEQPAAASPPGSETQSEAADDDLLEVELPTSTPAPLFNYDEPPSPASESREVESMQSHSSQATPRLSDALCITSPPEVSSPKTPLDTPASSKDTSVLERWPQPRFKKTTNKALQPPEQLSTQSGQPLNSLSQLIPDVDRVPSKMAAAQRVRRTVAKRVNWHKGNIKAVGPRHANEDTSRSGQCSAGVKEVYPAKTNDVSRPSVAAEVQVMQDAGDATAPFVFKFELPAWIWCFQRSAEDGKH